jgi:hypothetical protein
VGIAASVSRSNPKESTDNIASITAKVASRTAAATVEKGSTVCRHTGL